jgi:hypothetical protein
VEQNRFPSASHHIQGSGNRAIDVVHFLKFIPFG